MCASVEPKKPKQFRRHTDLDDADDEKESSSPPPSSAPIPSKPSTRLLSFAEDLEENDAPEFLKKAKPKRRTRTFARHDSPPPATASSTVAVAASPPPRTAVTASQPPSAVTLSPSLPTVPLKPLPRGPLKPLTPIPRKPLAVVDDDAPACVAKMKAETDKSRLVREDEDDEDEGLFSSALVLTLCHVRLNGGGCCADIMEIEAKGKGLSLPRLFLRRAGTQIPHVLRILRPSSAQRRFPCPR